MAQSPRREAFMDGDGAQSRGEWSRACGGGKREGRGGERSSAAGIMCEFVPQRSIESKRHPSPQGFLLPKEEILEQGSHGERKTEINKPRACFRTTHT